MDNKTNLQHPPEQPTPTINQAPQPSFLRATTRYYTGLTVFQYKNVELEWSQNNHIRALIIEANTTPTVLFDVTPQEITQASIALTQLVLVIRGKKYRFDFANGAMTGLIATSAASGITPATSLTVGLAADASAYNVAKNSGANDWIAALKQANVSIAGSTDPNHLTKFALIVTAVGFGGLFLFILLFFIIYMINE